MKLPKLNLTASDDELEPSICHIFVNENEIVSTNAYILIKTISLVSAGKILFDAPTIRYSFFEVCV